MVGVTPDDYRGQAVFRVREYGGEHGHFRFEADLAAADGPPLVGWGLSPWEAVRDLVSTHPSAFELALASDGQSVDALLSLGEWRTQPEDELVALQCMVLRDQRRVPVDHEMLRLALPEDAAEVCELARWLLHRWREARGLAS